ncbi:MAG: hypothetical protein OWQ50_00530 [Acidianus infernus]|nr:hypothetical protein [Acidianus infernus]
MNGVTNDIITANPGTGGTEPSKDVRNNANVAHPPKINCETNKVITIVSACCWLKLMLRKLEAMLLSMENAIAVPTPNANPPKTPKLERTGNR